MLSRTLVLWGCYTMQLVSQRIYFKNWSFMIRDVTRCNVSCNLSRNISTGRDLFLNSEFLLAARQKYCETSCKMEKWPENALQRRGNRS